MPGQTFSLTAPAAERLDRFVAEQGRLSRSQVQKLIRQGYITVNGRAAIPSQRLRAGDRVQVVLPPSPPTALIPEEIPVPLLYEDDQLIVVDKPAGLTVHPAPGHPRGTLINALVAHLPSLAEMEGSRPGLVHRLDKDSSGLLIVARNPAAWLNLSRQFKARQVVKRYLVLVRGRLAPPQGVIQFPLGRHPRHRQKMAVVAGGGEASTRYQVVRYLNGFTLVEATLETGRTHQIRVHFSAAGYPVVGDSTYGVKSPHLSRQFVHASYLCFSHPVSGQPMEFSSPLPTELQQALKELSIG